MLITRCNTIAELNEKASETIIRELQQNPQSLICAATGNCMRTTTNNSNMFFIIVFIC